MFLLSRNFVLHFACTSAQACLFLKFCPFVSSYFQDPKISAFVDPAQLFVRDFVFLLGKIALPRLVPQVFLQKMHPFCLRRILSVLSVYL
jgi:hypothetical protein